MKNPLTLLEHIQQMNAKTTAWVNENPTKRWAALLTEDIGFWKEWYNVTTVEEFEEHCRVSEEAERQKEIRKGGYDY